MSDRPFGCPIDIELDLPPPPSVNSIWMRSKAGKRSMYTAPAYTAWKHAADALILATGQMKGLKPIIGAFEAHIILCERQNGIDLDNSCKAVIDYAKRLNLIVDDAPKFLRRVLLEWGDAPHGCRLILRPREPN